MKQLPPLPAETPVPTDTFEDEIQEDHLRLAVLLDQIEDDLDEHLPVGGRIAQLTAEFEQHAMREERALAGIANADHAEHKGGHDRMRELLRQLAKDYDGGADIRPNLHAVLRLFTDQLLPADAIFISR
ncbi:MAG: hypothetical protein H7Y60_05425 [Rhodospirillaceae bacterium]|nr:hypothetical protein [Rhodospirillales bacterium]